MPAHSMDALFRSLSKGELAPVYYLHGLEDLLKDSRHLVTRRYLRQLYVDPMTAQAFTPLLAPQGGVWGVASSSSKSPIRAKSPNEATVGTRSAPSYRDWRFIYDGA